MELRKLRSFVVLAHELHFGRAARRLGISQPALSEQLQRLEDAVGARLLERTTRSVILTDVGRAFLPRAELTVRAAEEAVATARLAAADARSPIRVGATPLAMAAVPPTARELRRRTPAYELVVEVARPHAILARLLRGQLDAGLALCPPTSSRLHYEVFRYERMAVALPGDRPAEGGAAVTVHDLRGLDVLTYPSAYPSTFGWSIAAAWRRSGAKPSLREHLSFDETAAFVAGREGVALVPDGRTTPPPGVSVAQLTPPVTFPVAVFWDGDAPTSAVEALVAALRGISRRGGWLRGAEFGVPLAPAA